uniref:Uncharacterized protein n=1 Tax=Lygus hesperus TaxID=30085 RepID=A0A0A9X874_LYGHE
MPLYLQVYTKKKHDLYMDNSPLRIRVPLHSQHTVKRTTVSPRATDTVKALHVLLTKYCDTADSDRLPGATPVATSAPTHCTPALDRSTRYFSCNVNCIRDGGGHFVALPPSCYTRRRGCPASTVPTYTIYSSPLFQPLRCAVCGSTDLTSSADSPPLRVCSLNSFSVVLHTHVPQSQPTCPPAHPVYCNPFRIHTNRRARARGAATSKIKPKRIGV